LKGWLPADAIGAYRQIKSSRAKDDASGMHEANNGQAFW